MPTILNWTFLRSLRFCFVYKKGLAELMCERVIEMNDSRYEQSEISSEEIEQELRPAVC